VVRVSAAEHLQEAIDVGCTRDDHDHVADHRAEVLVEAAATADRIAQLKLAFGEFLAGRGARHVARAIRRMTDAEQPGKDTSDAAQAPAGESTQAALGPNGCPFCADSTNPDLRDHVLNVHHDQFASWAGIRAFVPRTEREYWVDIADALNAANAAGMPVGIDMEGILTDHQAWAVVWNREQQRWEVGGYEDDSPAESPADAEDWVICCSPSPRCPNGERRARAVERGWTQNGRAGNWLCATHSPSDFFRPDRTYTRSSSYGRTASFRVTHISTPPGGGERMAFGWKHLGEYDAWTDYSSDDFAAWTEVGEVR
jgi:hypothetical protein